MIFWNKYHLKLCRICWQEDIGMRIGLLPCNITAYFPGRHSPCISSTIYSLRTEPPMPSASIQKLLKALTPREKSAPFLEWMCETLKLWGGAEAWLGHKSSELDWLVCPKGSQHLIHLEVAFLFQTALFHDFTLTSQVSVLFQPCLCSLEITVTFICDFF